MTLISWTWAELRGEESPSELCKAIQTPKISSWGTAVLQDSLELHQVEFALERMGGGKQDE